MEEDNTKEQSETKKYARGHHPNIKRWKPGFCPNPSGRPASSIKSFILTAIKDAKADTRIEAAIENATKGNELVLKTTPEAGHAFYKEFIMPALMSRVTVGCGDVDISDYATRKKLMDDAYNSLMRGDITKSEYDIIADATDKYQKVVVQPAVEKELEDMGK